MTYDPRTIAFLSEVLFNPIELPSDRVQGIHNSLFRQQELSYHNFQVAEDGIHLTNLPQNPGGVSSVTFLPDRLVFREELQNLTMDDFAMRLVNVTRIAFQELGIEETYAQQFGVRQLISPRHIEDSRVFLTERLMGTTTPQLQSFGRPIESVGIRYAFPQHEDELEVFQLRIENWNQDPRSIWIENLAQFNTPTTTDNTPILSERLNRTYDFLVGPVFQFLSAFDRP